VEGRAEGVVEEEEEEVEQEVVVVTTSGSAEVWTLTIWEVTISVEEAEVLV